MPHSASAQNSKDRNRKTLNTSRQMADCVQRQMILLGKDKEKRTTAEQKVDSQLLAVIRCAPELPTSHDALSLAGDLVMVESDGRTVVDIVVRDLQLVQSHLKAAGKTPKSHIEILSAIGNNIRARLRLEQITTVAAYAEVVFINPQQEARLQKSHTFSNRDIRRP